MNKAAQDLLMGIDLGTSNVKAVIFDRTGRIRGDAGRRLEIMNPTPERAEQDMEGLWQITATVTREVIDQTGIDPSSLLAVGITGQGTGCWLLDRECQPVGNGIPWIDGRARHLIEHWIRTGQQHRVFELTGNSLFPGSPVSILGWLATHQPETLERAHILLFPKDWIKYRLTGRIVTDPSDLSVFPLPLDRPLEEVLRCLDIPFPARSVAPVNPSTEVVGEVSGEAALKTGLRVGTPVVNGVVDVVACALSLGVFEEGQAFSILGTTGFNGVVTTSRDHLFLPPDVGISIRYPLPGAYIRAMGTMAGTLNSDWFLDTFFKEEQKRSGEKHRFFQQVEHELDQVPPGSSGVIFLPYVSPGGERAPFVDPNACAQFFGLSRFHTKAHLARAVYEGVAFSIFDCLMAIPQEVREVRLAGGGARSSLWCQMIADVTGCRVVVPPVEEMGARGAAMLAGVGIGLTAQIQDVFGQDPGEERVYVPDPCRHQVYQGWFELYRKTREQMGDLWTKRRDLLEQGYC